MREPNTICAGPEQGGILPQRVEPQLAERSLDAADDPRRGRSTSDNALQARLGAQKIMVEEPARVFETRSIK